MSADLYNSRQVLILSPLNSSVLINKGRGEGKQAMTQMKIISENALTESSILL